MENFKRLKIALIADELTSVCLSYECRIAHITPLNYKLIIKWWKPDILFVESAWLGYKGRWKRQINGTNFTGSEKNKITTLVNFARKHRIPTIFWNKEDGVHFDKFINTALLFDYIFTVDANMIAKYRKRLINAHQHVSTLMFAIQPKIHFLTKAIQREKSFCFIGSYSRHIHDTRRDWQNMLFSEAQNYGLVIYDRNSDRRSYNYRYPEEIKAVIRPKILHSMTGEIYKKYMGYLNVNTVTDSPTMFSRRLIEIIACGSPVITTPALSLKNYFSEYVFEVESKYEVVDAMNEISRNHCNTVLKERLEAGAEYVLQNHTYHHRLCEIMDIVG